MIESEKTYCGYVALVGRPSVGKSTLLNTILQKKISITSKKPQTTRNRLLGIKTAGNYQTVYVDTPGIYKPGGKKRRGLTRYLEKATSMALYDVDLVVFMIEAMRFGEDDQWILEKIVKAGKKCILVINKVDTLKDKEVLLSFINELQSKHDFYAVIPLSATRKKNLQVLEKEIAKNLPESPFFFGENDVTDRSDKFYASEIIREKLIYALGAELPYSLAVQIENFKIEKNILNIDALILIERPSQKAIVIGKKGEKLKDVGTKARKELEQFFDRKIFLKLWVKVKSNWPDDERALTEFGYSDNK